MAHYHCSMKSGTRGSGNSAAVKMDYINRDGKYSDRKDLGYAESGNMPEWAKSDPKSYWKAADDFERANGTLYHEIEFALPNEISLDDAIKTVRNITLQSAMTDDNNHLPYSLAIHEKDGNRHCHLLLSARKNDGESRTPDTWFKRHPIGAEKADLYNKDFCAQVRLTVEVYINAAYRANNIDKCVDSRSYKDQGLDKLPQLHIGQQACAQEKRTGKKSERRERSEDAIAAHEAKKTIDAYKAFNQEEMKDVPPAASKKSFFSDEEKSRTRAEKLKLKISNAEDFIQQQQRKKSNEIIK